MMLTLKICGEEARTVIGLHKRIASQLKIIVAVCSDTTLSPTHRIGMLPSCKHLHEFRNTIRVLQNVVFQKTNIRDESAWHALDLVINNLIRHVIKRVPPSSHQIFDNFVSCFSGFACALCGALSVMREKKFVEIK